MIQTEQFLKEETWRYFWHPVCTLKELRDANTDGRGNRKFSQLLGEELVIAETSNGVIALNDRCPHRSASLSLGWVEDDCIRCPYHGWKYNSDGQCVEIPAAPDLPIPPNALAKKYDVQVMYNLVWVRLEQGVDIPIPDFPDYDDPEMKLVYYPTYEWKTSAARRLENFVDLQHFAWVHDGTLGDRNFPEYPVPQVDQSQGQLRWLYRPYENTRTDGANQNVVERSEYVITMPFNVQLSIYSTNGNRTGLWMISSPMDSGNCRNFTYISRNHFDDEDQVHIDFDTKVYQEDLPVIESQKPREIPNPTQEISIPQDKVLIFYRRWLKEMSNASEKGHEELQVAWSKERCETKAANNDKNVN